MMTKILIIVSELTSGGCKDKSDLLYTSIINLDLALLQCGIYCKGGQTPPARNLQGILDREQENIREYSIFCDSIGYPYNKSTLIINRGLRTRDLF